MKRIIALLLCAVLSASFAGCSQETETKVSGSASKSVSDILSSAYELLETTAPVTQAQALDYPALDFSAEVDLTSYNANMIYAEVSSMMQNPEVYVGKTVKANGTFDVFADINTGKYYYACIIQDATACCQNGLEFVPSEDCSYPDDFPDVTTPITIGGVFGTYEENGQTYCCLKDAVFSAA